MKEEGLFLEKNAAFYVAELLLAVGHLHHVGIIHRWNNLGSYAT